MREILFRGKTKHGKWVYGWFCGKTLNHMMDGTEECSQIIHSDTLYWHVVEPETVGQFTGLTDKNGKKIFEGDIVKCRHRLYRISFEELEDKKIRRSYGKEIEEASVGGFNCLYWRNYTVSIYDGCVRIQNGSDSHYIRKNYIYNHAIEVIGNIHDNPELLEEGDS